MVDPGGAPEPGADVPAGLARWVAGSGARLEWIDGNGRRGRGRVVWAADGRAGPGMDRVGRAGPLELSRTVRTTADGSVVVEGVIRNTGALPVRVGGVGLVSTARTPPGWESVSVARVFLEGFTSWSTARSWAPSERQRLPVPAQWHPQCFDLRHLPSGKAGSFRADGLAVLAPEAGPALALGWVGATRAYGGVDVVLDASSGALESLVVSVDLDDVTLAAGAETPLEVLRISVGDDPVALAEDWAAELGARQQARVPDRSPVGWCSWYHYFTSITEDAVGENLDALAGWDDLRFDYVMIDDGWQAAIGDWLDTNPTFPSGMEAVAGRIRAAGCEPGIWWAPFLVDPRSRVATDHPDWFVTGPSGRPRGVLWNPLWARTRRMWALDLTRPEVLDHLRGVASALAAQGYAVQKLDFLYVSAIPGRVADPDRTRARRLRDGLGAIRDGIGEQGFLLGCGCPLTPAVGLVDGMRISCDVAPYWDQPFDRHVLRDQAGATLFRALRNVLTRQHHHRRLWVNDPDCLMIRTSRTRLNAEEVLLQGRVVAATDGMVVLSDRLADVPPERRELLVSTLAELGGGRARVPDLLDLSSPRLLDRWSRGEGEAGGAATRVAVDWDRHSSALRLPPGAAT